MGVYSQKIAKLLRKDEFGSLLPVIEYLPDDKIFVLEEPAIASMIICQPTSGTNYEIQNAFNTIYRSGYPDDTTIQAQIVCTPDVEDFLYGYQAVRNGRMENQDKEKCEALSDSIRDFYRRGTTDSINNAGFKFRNIEFWFTVKIPIKGAVPTREEIEQLKEITALTYARLNHLGPQLANERDYYRRLKVLFNMYDTDGWRKKAQHKDKEYRTLPLKHLILEPGKRVELESDGVAVYDTDDNECLFMRTATILELPEQIYHGFMLNLMGDWQSGTEGLFDPFMISLNIIVPNQDKAKAAVSRQRTFVTNQAQGPLLKFVDKLGFQKADYDVVEREITQESAAILKYSLQIVTFSKNREEANVFMKKLQGFYSRQSIKLVPDNHFVLPFLLANLPFGLHQLYQKYSSRFNTATSKMMTFITPYLGSWKGNAAYPTFLLASRLGQLCSFDLFKSNSNYNLYVAARSGAGKSFFTSYLVSCMLASGLHKQADADNPLDAPDDGSQVFIVDVGGSYKGLTEQYEDAKYLEFGHDLKYSMNPFPNIIDMYGKDGEANMVRSILKAMAAPSGKVTDYQNSEILSVISDVWEQKGRQATVTDVAHHCLEHPDPEMIRFGKQLRPFTDDGVYADFFSNKYPPVDYNSRLIVLEMEQLRNDPHLQVVCLMALVMSIQKTMMLSGTEKRQLFAVDEGWMYLKDEGTEAAVLRFFAEFLETGWRRFRKVNACGALITQSVMDAYESNVGKAIIANSAWLMLMSQEKEAIDKLEQEKMYSGSKGDFEMIRSLRTQKPNPGISDEAFSEIYVRYEGTSQVCRLYTDRKFQLMQTTTPEEKAIRQKYMNQGMSLEQAVEQMLVDEGVP